MISSEEDFNKIAFNGTYSIKYIDHWGPEGLEPVQVTNPTWMDLWRAADGLIKASGDHHHIFIEQFAKSKEPNTLRLITGS